MTPDRDPSMIFSGYPLALRRCLNFKRPSSNVLFEDETIFYAWWVARGEVRRLEGLGRLVMGFDIPNGIFCESFPFEHCAIEKSDLVVGYFGREFDSRVEIVSSFNKPLFCRNPNGRKRHQCNVSILLAWYRFAGLIPFPFPP